MLTRKAVISLIDSVKSQVRPIFLDFGGNKVKGEITDDVSAERSQISPMRHIRVYFGGVFDRRFPGQRPSSRLLPHESGHSNLYNTKSYCKTILRRNKLSTMDPISGPIQLAVAIPNGLPESRIYAHISILGGECLDRPKRGLLVFLTAATKAGMAVSSAPMGGLVCALPYLNSADKKVCWQRASSSVFE